MPFTTAVPLAVRSVPSLRASLAGVERVGATHYARVVLDGRAELEDGTTLRFEQIAARVRLGPGRRARPAAQTARAPEMRVVRAEARPEGPVAEGPSGPSAVLRVDLEIELPSAGVRLRSRASRVGIALEPGPSGRAGARFVKAPARPLPGAALGRLAVRGLSVGSVRREGSVWWADVLVDLEATISSKRVRGRAVPVPVRVYHQRLPR